MEASTALALTLKLDDRSLEVLENMAATQRCTVDECVMGLLRKALRVEEKTRTNGAGHGSLSGKARPRAADAPLDAFLPEGADPFAPVTHGDIGLASSFADVQTRMRFAGTPSLLRDRD